MGRYIKYPVALLLGWLSISPSNGMAAGVLKLSTPELRLVPDQRQGALYALNTGDSPLYLDVEQALVNIQAAMQRTEDYLKEQQLQRPN